MGQQCCLAADDWDQHQPATEGVGVASEGEAPGSKFASQPPLVIEVDTPTTASGSHSPSLSQSALLAKQHPRAPQGRPASSRHRVVSFNPFTRQPRADETSTLVDDSGSCALALRGDGLGSLPDESDSSLVDRSTTATAVLNPLSIGDGSSLFRGSQGTGSPYLGDAMLDGDDCLFPLVDGDTPYAAQLAIRREDEPQCPMDPMMLCGERF